MPEFHQMHARNPHKLGTGSLIAAPASGNAGIVSRSNFDGLAALGFL
jgi:hypothetical protein